MKYFKLLKETPTAYAGTIFSSSDRWNENGDRIFTAEGRYETIRTTELVIYDNLGTWFEEVEQIFVKPKNVERLVEIDEKADNNTLIASPITFPAYGPGVINSIPLSGNVNKVYASKAHEDRSDCGGVCCE